MSAFETKRMNQTRASNASCGRLPARCFKRLVVVSALSACAIFSTGCAFLAGAAIGGAVIYAVQQHHHTDGHVDEDHVHDPDIEYDHTH